MGGKAASEAGAQEHQGGWGDRGLGRGSPEGFWRWGVETSLWKAE